MQSRTDRDTQPEKDVTPARMVSLSMGLVLSCGLIFGALVGALLGRALLDNALGWGHDILLGAIVGAIVVAAAGAITVRAMSARIAESNRR